VRNTPNQSNNVKDLGEICDHAGSGANHLINILRVKMGTQELEISWRD